MIKNIRYAVMVMTLLSSTVMAASTVVKQDTKQESGNSNQLQTIIEEYKSYLATVPKEIREEILAYRNEIDRINKTKRDLYKKLSQDAQVYLAKEQEFKKKLPMKQRGQININKFEKKNDNTE